MTIGTKIGVLRKKHKLSQPDLAFKLDISQTALSEIESGKTKKIDFLLIDKVCRIFDVDFGYFLDDQNVYNLKNNTGFALGDHTTINISAPECILENMLKRLEQLEQKLKPQ